MDAWLTRAREALAAASGVSPESLELDRDTERTLLDLARIAAHDSGARTNAPLLTYLLGLAQSRGTSLTRLADAVRQTAD